MNELTGGKALREVLDGGLIGLAAAIAGLVAAGGITAAGGAGNG